MAHASSSLVLAASLTLGACAGGDEAATSLDAGRTDGAMDTGAADGAIVTDGGLDGTTTGPGYVYPHTFLELYRMDTATFELTKIGAFVRESGEAFVPPSGIEDIAIDKNGVMYGLAQDTIPEPAHGALFRLDYRSGSGKVVCKPIKTDAPIDGNGLTFVPAGMLDATTEVMVASGASWLRVDVGPTDTSAKVTKIAGLPAPWVSLGGDSVGIIGDAVYTTAGNGGTDSHLLTWDPKAGTVKDLGSTGVGAFWGLGYWGGELFGFVNDGSMWRIDRATAKATKVKLSIDGLGWYGAAVTTSAPVTIK